MNFSINFSGRGTGIAVLMIGLLSSCTRAWSPPEWKGGSGPPNNFRIAVFPVENLSGTDVPLREFKDLLTNKMRERGFTVIGEEELAGFMARHRIRNTGAIDMEEARALKEETGTNAVLITTFELFSRVDPPKIAVTARLVGTEESNQRILWMESLGHAGDASPGFLGLGLINNPKVLLQLAAENLTYSLERFLSGNPIKRDSKGRKGIFQPKMQYSSNELGGRGDLLMAVVPFHNLSSRRHAGEIISLHFIRSLRKAGKLSIVEPGDVRKKLLDYRVIMWDGISLANADLLFEMLQADLILTGRVFDYQDYQGARGTTKVDFSVLVLERKSRKVVWFSKSINEGDDRVYLFDWGMLKTANELAAEMVDAVIHSILN